MSLLDKNIYKIKKETKGYWSDRILTQLEYAAKLSAINQNQFQGLIEEVQNYLIEIYKKEGVLGREISYRAEELMEEIGKQAKRYKMICASHAHIDMNWQWRWDETVAITIDTFRTILNLMEEYPDFTFSQSQASVYKIIEQYNPEMLEEIKKRIKEGRWEVTASTWVEADKNMPNGESMARHILYTKRYLSRLLDLDPDDLNIDFEPDTFGHNHNVPEILTSGGVRYYYHCRGYDGHNLYRWQSPSGSSVLVYREPIWYNAQIKSDMTLYVPEFCHKYGLDNMLKVYGVGDHGGGPTRRDLERIIDMNNWPVFPEIRFGTFKEFYESVEDSIEKTGKELPVVNKELNFIFTGCYTSQSRIKMANKTGENILNEAETFDSITALKDLTSYSGQDYAGAWQNILFNQFHDIIPGSGVIDTREHAMGLFQETMAVANTRRKLALEAIAAEIDTSDLIGDEETKDTTSEGAGVGYGLDKYRISQTARGSGTKRIFHVFNSAPFSRTETAEITLWDWHGDIDRLRVKDSDGEEIRHQLMEDGYNTYWGHKYLKILIKAELPAGGYNTYLIEEAEDIELDNSFPIDPRVEQIEEYELENKYLRVVFDSHSGVIKSLYDKKTDTEYIDSSRNGGLFRFIKEDDKKGMTSWIVGRYMNITDLDRGVSINKINSGPIRQTIRIKTDFKKSSLSVNISLDKGSSSLDFEVECDWFERGRKGEGIPQLNYYLPLNYKCKNYKYDIPFGTIEREGMDRDVPANSWALGVPEEKDKKAVMLSSDSKYGFRCKDNSLALTLIRGSFDPDPYPEIGIHRFNFKVSLVNQTDNKEYIKKAYNNNHPVSVVSARPGSGTLPLQKGFIDLKKGSVCLSAIKMMEENLEKENKNMLLRVYETEGQDTEVKIKLPLKPVDAYYVDINEIKVENQNEIKMVDTEVEFKVEANCISNICLKF